MPDRNFSKRLDYLDRETSFEVLAIARALEREGREIIHLEIGEPDFDTPANIVEAGVEALRKGYTHYGPSLGLGEVREAIAAYVARDRGIEVRHGQVVVTPGAKSIIFLTMLALLDPGDEVIYPDPGFPNYETAIRFAGGSAVALELREDEGFRFDIDRFESLITPRTRLCVINTPQNPTGAVLSRESLEGIAELARKNDFYVLSDEIYSKIVYDDGFTSFYSLGDVSDRTILLDGFSKTYAMTGWRLGYGIMPERLAQHFAKMISNSTSCTCTFTQLAGVAALSGPQDSVRAMVDEFRRRRDLIVDGLNSIAGIHCHKPAGAFYVFPNIASFGRTSKETERHLMEKAGVAVLSGTTFGDNGEGFIRMSYATSQDNIRLALSRVAGALQR